MFVAVVVDVLLVLFKFSELDKIGSLTSDFDPPQETKRKSTKYIK